MTGRAFAVACLASAVLALGPRPALPADKAAATPDELLSTIQKAHEAFQQNKNEEAGQLIERVLKQPAFAEMSPQIQYVALSVAGYAAMARNDFLAAHEYFTIVTEFDAAQGEAWLYRAFSATRVEAWPDTVVSLTTLAKKFPKTLSAQKKFVAQLVFRSVGQLRGVDQRPAKLALIQALFDAEFTDEYDGQPGVLWQELAVDALAQNDLPRARAVASRITNADVLVAMRIDRRFDALVAAEPKLFDVRAAAEREVKRLRAQMSKNPKSLGVVMRLGNALFITGDFGEMLKVANDALARDRKGTEKSPAYDDADDNLNWVYNQQSMALRALGRWDEALAAMRAGAGAAEHGETNTSQTINLGFFLVELGRPKDALAEVERIDWNKGASPYGRMQLQFVRALSWQQLGRKDETDKIIAWFREHEIDSKDTAQDAYMETGDENAAAALLIARLGDPDDRAAALLDVQDFRQLPPSEQDRKTAALRDRLHARADVTAAIDAVGRREKLSVYTLDF